MIKDPDVLDESQLFEKSFATFMQYEIENKKIVKGTLDKLWIRNKDVLEESLSKPGKNVAEYCRLLS